MEMMEKFTIHFLSQFIGYGFTLLWEGTEENFAVKLLIIIESDNNTINSFQTILLEILISVKS